MSTCFLYLVAAGESNSSLSQTRSWLTACSGLFSKAVWFLEVNAWNKVVGGDASETGSGPGSYDIRQSVWHVNCCNPQLNGGGGWGIFNSILGWQNSATYGSVLAYNLYWLVVIIVFASMRYYEKTGHWPLLKAKAKREDVELVSSSSQSDVGVGEDSYHGKVAEQDGAASTTVREVGA